MLLCPKCCCIIDDNTKICPDCGALIVEEVEEVIEDTLDESFFKKIPKKVKVFSLCLLSLILAVAIVLTCVNITSLQSLPVLYIKDKELFFKSNKLEKPVQITTELLDWNNIDDDSIYDSFYTVYEYLDLYVKLSVDGNILFYPDKISSLSRVNELYYCYPNSSKITSVKIDSDILAYLINEKGDRVTYISSNNNTLYQHNLKSKTEIDSDVYKFVISDDGKKIVYSKTDGEIYCKIEGEEKQRLGKGVLIVANNNFDNVYIKDNYILYKVEDGNKINPIATGVSEVLRYYDSGEIYYLTEMEEKLYLEDYLEDDMKASDDGLKRPDYVSYPARWDYDTEEEYNKAIKEYEKSDYHLLSEQWNEKVNRDEIRDSVYTESLDFDYYSLCYYNGRYEKVLDQSVVSTEKISFAQDSPAIIFRTAELNNIKKVKISKVKDIAELRNKIIEQINQLIVTKLAVKSTTSAIGYNDVDNYYLAPDATVVFYLNDINYDKAVTNLYKMDINSTKPRKPKLYEKDVVIDTPYIFSENVAYYKYGENKSIDLYINKEKVGSNIISTVVSKDKKALIYMADYNYQTSQANLNVYKNGKIKKIEDMVLNFTQLNNGDILYKNFNSNSLSECDLLIYHNGKSEKIDNDVSHIFSPDFINCADIGEDILIN